MAASSLIWALIALILPPLPVAIRKGCSGHLILNIILLLLAWIPAVLHAWYVILEYDNHGQKKIDRRIQRARNEERVRVLENEKVPVPEQQGNMQGWYAPAPQQQPSQHAQKEGGMEPEIQQAPLRAGEVPEYARDVKH